MTKFFSRISILALPVKWFFATDISKCAVGLPVNALASKLENNVLPSTTTKPFLIINISCTLAYLAKHNLLQY